MSLALELRAVIERQIGAHPRSQQTAVGASEIGTPCPRKLAFKLGGIPVIRPETPAWRPTVGTAVHSWLEAALGADNDRLGSEERWLTETRVYVGNYGDRELWGHVDVVDLATKTVVDWKVPGVTTIKKAKAAKHPGDTYRVQAHCYGLGVENLGLEVRHVAVYFLPAAGELGDGYFWTEPYDRTIAETALTRAAGILSGLQQIGPDLIPLLPKAADYCQHCPFWQAGAVADERKACSGEGLEIRTPKSDGPAFGAVRN